MHFLAFFGQTFDPEDLAIIGLLVLLEGILSIDNALVLGLLAKRLPHKMQAKALTYGLVGAFVFRIIAIGTAAWLLKWRIVKLLGGGYLIYIAVKHLIAEGHKSYKNRDADPDAIPEPTKHAGFWGTVIAIELTDIAFAIDSILAAIALVGGSAAPGGGTHPKLWVVIAGGMFGVILMRFAAVLFIKLLEKFPRFEMSAYLLVLIIGLKLLVDWWFNVPEHPHAVNFHSPGAPAFWIFWGMMAICFSIGFIKPKKNQSVVEETKATEIT